jgi:hypothetical protein
LSNDSWNFDFDNPEFMAHKTTSYCECGNVVQSGKKFCSNRCNAKSQEVIEWPADLPQLVAESSKRKIAKMLGVSDKAVAKRLSNHH